jgi:DNA-binding transcriptional LysR family regulator
MNEVDLEAGTVFNETSLCLSAAMAGAGIAIGDSFLAFEPLKKGTLVPPFPQGVRSHEAYMLYRRANVGRSTAQETFESWIIEALDDYTKEVEQLLSCMDVRIELRAAS